MKTLMVPVIIVLLLGIVVAGCRSGTPTVAPISAPTVVPTTAPTKPPAAATTAAPTKPPTAAPTKPPAVTAAPAAGQSSWNDLVAAAKKEGELLIYINAPNQTRTDLPAAFGKVYGIQVDVITGSGAEVAARMEAEYQAGIHNVDVMLPGASSLLSAKKQGFLAPIEPALILPEVKDPSLWLGGSLPYFDKDHMILGYLSQRIPNVVVNSEAVKPGQITSYLDLLKPEWKDKMSMFDPSVSGGGSGAMVRLVMQWGLDKANQYLEDLLVKQQVVVSKNMGQQTDWLAKGKYPVSVWGQTPALVQYLQAGAPLADANVKEKPGLSPSNGGIGLPKYAPHPNAALVFVNWWLSKEGQAVAVKSMGFGSARADVPATGVDPMFVIKPGEAFILQDETYGNQQTDLAPQWKAIMAKAGY